MMTTDAVRAAASVLRQARARHYRDWLLPLLTCLFAVQAWGQAEDCTQLPEARQAMCWMVLSCSTLEDAESRQECFQAAYEGFRATSQPGVAGDAASEEIARPSEEIARPSEEIARPSEEITLSSEAIEAPQVAKIPDPPEDQMPAYIIETERQAVFTIAAQFSAVVTQHQKLMRDRQILVLDDRLLFEGDGALGSRLQIGDRVDVRRTSKFFGERYKIVAPGSGEFSVSRVPCEDMAISADSRRKCDVLLPQWSASVQD